MPASPLPATVNVDASVELGANLAQTVAQELQGLNEPEVCIAVVTMLVHLANTGGVPVGELIRELQEYRRITQLRQTH